MPLVVSKCYIALYDALKEAGASEEKARKAAEAVAQWETRLGKIEADLGVLKWMVGTTLVLTVAGMSVVVGLLLNIARLVELVSK
jgi:hypothetical protein